MSPELGSDSNQSPGRRRSSTQEIWFDNDPELHDIMECHGLGRRGFPRFLDDPFGLEDFNRKKIAQMLPRVGLALAVFNSGLYFNNVSQAWLQSEISGYYLETMGKYCKEGWLEMNITRADGWQANPGEGHMRLWDIGFHYFTIPMSTKLADTVAGILPTFVWIRFFIIPGPLSMRWTIYQRIHFIWGILWALRGISIVSTVLPNPDRTCTPKITFPNNIFMEAWANMPWVFWHSELTCEDVLFSGHTVGLTLGTLVFMRYEQWTPWFGASARAGLQSMVTLLRIALMSQALIGYYVIIASKFHYSADVLVGFLMTLMIFSWYHTAVRIAFLPQGKQSAAMRCTLYPFLRWFEGDAIDVAVLKLHLQQAEASSSSQTSIELVG